MAAMVFVCEAFLQNRSSINLPYVCLMLIPSE